MLPITYMKSNIYKYDVSGLGGEGGQDTGHIAFSLNNVGTDQMNLVKTEITSEGAENRAFIKGEEVKSASHFTNEIVNGFKDTYNLFLKYKKDLVSHNGPLRNFERDIVRIILRSTQVYSTFLEASFHPDYLKSGYSRERLINFLWLGLKIRPDFKNTIEFECRDLLRGDIPYFYSCVNSTNLYHSSGMVEKGYFQRPNIESLIAKAQSLNEGDMSAQIEYIKSSLVIQETNKSDIHSLKSNNHFYIFSDQRKKVDPEQFLRISDSIGSHIARKAIFGREDDVIWNGINVNTEKQFKFSPLESSLYDGLLGIGLFYAHLYNVTGKKEYKTLADKSLKTSLGMLFAVDKLSISAFYGYGSYVYVLSNYSFLFNDKSYLIEAKKILNKAIDEVKNDQLLDYLGGSAGLIIMCIHLYKRTGDDYFLNVANHCGEFLLLKSEIQTNGIAWRSAQLEKPITGLSHGLSGFSWAMLALSHFSKESHYKVAYVASMALENSLLNNESKQGVSNWCHGLAGIGMSRTMMSEYSDEKSLRSTVVPSKKLLKPDLDLRIVYVMVI